MLVCGEKERAEGKVAVRLRTGEDLGPQPLSEVISRIQAVISSRTVDL
jgi:threonyl-tRNA synthetase